MLVAFDYGARLELVSGAAIGTLGFAVVVELKEDARVRRPQRHGRIRAMDGEVLGAEFNGLGKLGCIAHRVLFVFYGLLSGAMPRCVSTLPILFKAPILTDTDHSTDDL